MRDMLKSLKRSYSEHPPQPYPPPSLPIAMAAPIPQSSPSISASTDSSLNLPSGHPPDQHRPQSFVQRRRAKTSTGPESLKSHGRDRHLNNPYGTAPSLTHKSSPRRPSLASIFKLGQKNKSSSTSNHSSPQTTTGADFSTDNVLQGGSSSSGHVCTSGSTEEDWDRVDSASDLDLAFKTLGLGADGTATVRGKKGKGRSPYSSQQSQLHQKKSGGLPETPK